MPILPRRTVPRGRRAVSPRSGPINGRRPLRGTALAVTALAIAALAATALASPAAPSGSPEAPPTSERPTPVVDRYDPATLGGASGGGGATEDLLQVDDGTAEGTFGFTGPGTRQFLFFNRFASPGPFVLDTIRVLFPGGAEVEAGDAVQLAVYTVPRGASADVAELRLRTDDVVQATDGATFSTYPLAEPLELFSGDDVLIGVVNRYYVTGSPPEETRPAAIDSTDPRAASFFALWAGDAADPPELSEAIQISPLDGLIAANFMIRGDGRPAPVVDIPTLDRLGILLLLAALLAAGLRVLATRR
ncbi:MAG: hypothetical protein AAGF23_06100 [Acidobacteriota bacterium]